MYKKHSRSLQSLKKIVNFSPSKSSFYHIVLIVLLSTPPRPNERDPNSCVVKMHRTREKRRGKGKRKKEQIVDQITKKKKLLRIDFSVVTPVQ